MPRLLNAGGGMLCFHGSGDPLANPEGLSLACVCVCTSVYTDVCLPEQARTTQAWFPHAKMSNPSFLLPPVSSC